MDCAKVELCYFDEKSRCRKRNVVRRINKNWRVVMRIRKVEDKNCGV